MSDGEELMAPQNDQAPQARVEVRPLLCSNCSGTVPLADGDTARCPWCGACVPIPESYRKIHDANRIAEADRAKIEAVYASLGAPPGLSLRAWARVAKSPWAVLEWLAEQRAFISITALVVAFVLALLWPYLLWSLYFDRRAPAWGFSFPDVLGLFWYALSLVIAFEIAFILPFILLGYKADVARIRSTLRADMAAQPPSKPGGPSECRECGAPLMVPAGALGVRCAYCGADNLVALPPEWVARVCSVSASRHVSVLSALQEEERAVAAARADRKGNAIAAIVLALFLAIVYWAIGRADLPPSWRGAVAQSPRSVVWGKDGELPLNRPRRLSIDRTSLSDLGFHIKVALHRGETFSVTATGLPSAERLYASSSGGRSRWDLAARPASKPNTTISEFTAPYSGWFDIHAHSDFGSPSRVDVTMVLSIKPPSPVARGRSFTALP